MPHYVKCEQSLVLKEEIRAMVRWQCVRLKTSLSHVQLHIQSILGNKKIPEAGQFAQRKEAYLSKDLVAGILQSRGVGSSERSSPKDPNADLASRENQNC